MQLQIVLNVMKEEQCVVRVYGRGTDLGLDIKGWFPDEVAFDIKSKR